MLTKKGIQRNKQRIFTHPQNISITPFYTKKTIKFIITLKKAYLETRKHPHNIFHTKNYLLKVSILIRTISQTPKQTLLLQK